LGRKKSQQLLTIFLVFFFYPDEKALLLKVISAFGKNKISWSQVSKQIKGRTGLQCSTPYFFSLFFFAYFEASFAAPDTQCRYQYLAIMNQKIA
jgi:hypothetical protein